MIYSDVHITCMYVDWKIEMQRIGDSPFDNQSNIMVHNYSMHIIVRKTYTVTYTSTDKLQ